MGRKVHPIGMRLGINQGWQGRWFAEGSQYREQLHQDFAIRSLLTGITSKGGAAKNATVLKLRKDLPDTIKNGRAGISRVEVERYPGKLRVAIFTAKPGILIGRKGEGVKKIPQCLGNARGQARWIWTSRRSVPPTPMPCSCAKNVADQLERRIAYRRAMKRAIQQAMKQGAEGIKILVGGRLGGAEMSRDVWLRDGRVPLQTLRANVDYAIAEATTTYGQIGVTVWIYKGEIYTLKLKRKRRQLKACT
jgi:small subunit ribosomal protein S3